MNVLLKNIAIVSPSEGINEVNDILIIDGVIQKIGSVKKTYKDISVINEKNFTCVPGLYDMHVHFREPGQTHKEDLLSGSEAAANGGFTGVLCMPNTNPPIDSPLLLKSLLEKAQDFLIDLDVAPCATYKRDGEKLSPILSLAEAGALAFTDDGSPVANPELMRRVLEFTSQTGSVFIQHCEDMVLSNKGVMNEGGTSTVLGLKGIPEVSETSVIARDILLTEYIKNSRYHIQHISCGKSVELLRDAKLKKLNVTGEVCPHHFILTDKDCEGFNTNAKMNPPLRSSADIEQILEGLRDDTIDVICTDHAPHTEYEKNQGFIDSPFGIVGLETAIGLAFTFLVKKNIISFDKMVEKMSFNPRHILKIQQPAIQEGSIANLSIIDLKKKWIVRKNRFKSKSINTPFEGYELTGKPYCVINKNKIYYSSL